MLFRTRREELKTLHNNSNTDLEFEKAAPGVEEYLDSLYRSAFNEYVRLLGKESSDSRLDWLPDAIKQGNIWVAMQENKMIGAVTIAPEGDHWLIDEIAVSPQFQGQGIGSWMLEKVEELARSQGVRRLSLCTAKKRSDLVRLYERFGFTVISEGPPKHNQDLHVRVFMEKSLD